MEKFRRHSIAIACSLFCTVALTACSSNNSGSSATKVENTAQVPKQQNAVKKEEQSTEASKKSEQPKTDNTQSKEHENTTPKVTSETKQEVSLDTHKEEQPQKVDNSQDQSNTNVSHLKNELPKEDSKKQDKLKVDDSKEKQTLKADNSQIPDGTSVNNPNNGQSQSVVDNHQNQDKSKVEDATEKQALNATKVDTHREEPHQADIDKTDVPQEKKTQIDLSSTFNPMALGTVDGGIISINKEGNKVSKPTSTDYEMIEIDGITLNLLKDKTTQQAYQAAKYAAPKQMQDKVEGYIGSRADKFDYSKWENMRWGVIKSNGENITAFIQGIPAAISTSTSKYTYEEVNGAYAKDNKISKLRNPSVIEVDFGTKDIAIKLGLADKCNYEACSISLKGKIKDNTFTAEGNGIHSKGGFFGGVGDSVGGLFEGKTEYDNKNIVGAFGASNKKLLKDTDVKLLNK
ncbi:transferrin-binding protein-like solute binding protein [Actinobacillus equuli]|uniref:transferrin-binding protein-like solute binding protein n=1 Tax=Actinobacillus equuli TaxID=718 RepID=UPI002442ADDF|nr:hypothetical protein [Actinobacillus equuli]WGE48465.1 hypothetical protein NYR67_09360 [Actinobacillus equuli subsp. equuli]